MDILVSTPGSPGTSFTNNVKEKIVVIFDVLLNNKNFATVRALGQELEKFDINWNYARNILPFLQNCGFVRYRSNAPIINKEFFTDLGYAFIDILKCISICEKVYSLLYNATQPAHFLSLFHSPLFHI